MKAAVDKSWSSGMLADKAGRRQVREFLHCTCRGGCKQQLSQVSGQEGGKCTAARDCSSCVTTATARLLPLCQHPPSASSTPA